MKKERYDKAELEVIRFTTTDIITGSSDDDDDEIGYVPKQH